MTPTIALRDVTRRYRGHLALDAVSLEVDGPSIVGLLGRNGAGKTTLMRIIAAQEFATAGEVRVLAADPVENESVLPRMVFAREDQAFPPVSVGHVLAVAAWAHPNWSAELATQLTADFDLPLKRLVPRLSRGQRSALGAVIGLAARAEVTLFDEPYAGLDAVARRLFYERLLADYAEHPRTVVLSTHLIDEAAGLLERVVLLDRGRVVLDMPADDARGAFTAVSGAADGVEQFAMGRPTFDRRRVGSRASAVIAQVLDDDELAKARALHLSVEPLSLQQVMVYAAQRAGEELTERTQA